MHHLASTNRRASASRENPKKRKLFFESRRLQPILPLSSSVHQTMDLDAVCARCALLPAFSLVKYVEAGREAANMTTNKPSKRKNELLGATWITDFPPEAKFRRRSDHAVLELPFRARTRVRPLDLTTRWHEGEAAALCSWLLELHQPEGAEGGPSRGREGAAAQIAWHVCSERPGAALQRPKAGPDAGKEKKGIECPSVASVSLCKLTS